MSISAIEKRPYVVGVNFGPSTLQVELADGRWITAPLDWFPRLRDANLDQQNNWRLIGGGIGIHWPDLDEDISVAGLLATK